MRPCPLVRNDFRRSVLECIRRCIHPALDLGIDSLWALLPKVIREHGASYIQLCVYCGPPGKSLLVPVDPNIPVIIRAR